MTEQDNPVRNRPPEQPHSTPREQRGEGKPIGPGPSGMEQTDDQDNLINNVSNLGQPPGGSSDKSGGQAPRPQQVRDAGPEEMRDRPPGWDKTDEAVDESFPASDPPAVS